MAWLPPRPSSCSMSSRLARTLHSAFRLSAPRAEAVVYSMVTGQGPGRQGSRIAARRSARRGRSACEQARTRREARSGAAVPPPPRAPPPAPPRVTELIEAQYALDQHQRVLDHEIAVPLPGLFEQHHLEPPGTVIEGEDDA